MAIRIVQSKSNPGVTELRAALVRGSRSGNGLVGLEGIHLVAEALASGIEIDTLYIVSGQESVLDDPLLRPHSPARLPRILALTAAIFRSTVTTETPQPIAALVHPPVWDWADLVATPSPLILVLDGLQDPGNLGTILRSAEAFGATGVVALPGTASCWNPKAIRASAGSVFRLPFVQATTAEMLAFLRTHKIATLASLPATSHLAAKTHGTASDLTPIGETNLAQPTALLIGSEGAGLSEQLVEAASHRVSIPCPGPVESLNAAIAASIMLYEAARQRQSRQP